MLVFIASVSSNRICFQVKVNVYFWILMFAFSRSMQYIYTHTHTYIHTYTHTHTHTHIHTHIHTYIHTHIYTHTYIHIQYIYTYIHTYIHTHTYIHIHIHTYIKYLLRIKSINANLWIRLSGHYLHICGGAMIQWWYQLYIISIILYHYNIYVYVHTNS